MLYDCLNQHLTTLECSHAFGSQLCSSLLLPLYLFLLLSSSSSSFCFGLLAPSSISSIYNGASRGGKGPASTRPSCFHPPILNLSILIVKSPLSIYLHPTLQSTTSPSSPIPPSSCLICLWLHGCVVMVMGANDPQTSPHYEHTSFLSSLTCCWWPMGKKKPLSKSSGASSGLCVSPLVGCD